MSTLEPSPTILQLRRAAEDMRGRERYIRLDRNERATPFSDTEFASMLGGLRPELFCAYPDPSKLIARLSRDLSVPEDWICLTNGSDAAIRKLFQTYLRVGDTVLLADPTYAMYPIYTQMFGGRVDVVSYGEHRELDVAAFRRRLRTRPRIAALACPDQPTGAVMTLEQIRAVAQDARDHGVLCIVDEAYYPFHPVTAIGLVPALDNLVVTRTFSKVGGLAGLRLGYFVAQREIVSNVDKVRGAHEVNAVAIHVGSHLLDRPEIGDAFVRDIEAGRVVLSKAAAELGFGVPPCPANFQLIELSPAVDAGEVARALKQRGYLIKSGFSHPSVARCIRVTLAGPDIMTPFVGVLREVCARAV